MSTIFILIIFFLAVGGAFLLFSKPSEDSSSKSSSEENIELGTNQQERENRASNKASDKPVSTKQQSQNFLKKNRSSTNPSVTPHQLPPTPSHIYGRKTALAEFIAILKKKIPILGVHGRSGMGKTKLIYILANRLLPNFRDAQFYIDMKADEKDPLDDSGCHDLRCAQFPANNKYSLGPKILIKNLSNGAEGQGNRPDPGQCKYK